MADRFCVCIVDPNNRVHFQSRPLLKADVPDAVTLAMTGNGGALEPLKPGWVITVTRHAASLVLASENDLREIGRRRLI